MWLRTTAGDRDIRPIPQSTACRTTSGFRYLLFCLHNSSGKWVRCKGQSQWHRQNFAPGGGGAWRRGSEIRGDKVIQKWKPSGVRSAKTNTTKVFCNSLPHSNSNQCFNMRARTISTNKKRLQNFACIKLQGSTCSSAPCLAMPLDSYYE